MSIFGKKEIERLEEENRKLKEAITPEIKRIIESNELMVNLEEEIQRRNLHLLSLEQEIKQKEAEVFFLDDAISFQSFGLYEPQYDFVKAEEYKNKLVEIRNQQKECIKSGNAVVSSTANWTINNSRQQGAKMIKDMQKLLLRAFNNECDTIVEKVTYSNFDRSLTRIRQSAEAISKLGSIMHIYITSTYLKLKEDELRLAFEYQIKKQEEKEALREARQEMREAAKAQKELEEQRKKLEKEQLHFTKAINEITKQIESADENQISDLLSKKEEIEKYLHSTEDALKDVDYREANQKAGYVYVISNIGSFGEDVFKIGMTRRLNPEERIDELGDASVPFDFDVHAMIFTDDAPALETALHQAFEKKKLNMINKRREFFHVSLDEIKEVVKNNFDKTVEFIDTPPADQYRQSKLLREA